MWSHPLPPHLSRALEPHLNKKYAYLLCFRRVHGSDGEDTDVLRQPPGVVAMGHADSALRTFSNTVGPS
jgi:hypothetical protein